MAVNVTNAFVGSPRIDGGVLFRAPLGTALPADAKEELHADFGDHGAAGEDGLQVSQERSTTDIKMFGGDDFLSVQDSYTEQVVVTVLEDDNDEVIKTAFGDNNYEKEEATGSDGTKRTIYHTSTPLPISSFVLDAAYGDKLKRYVISRGQVTSVGETTDVHNNVTSKQLTIKTYKPVDEELKGGNVVEYRDDGVLAGGGSTPEPGEGEGE